MKNLKCYQATPLSRAKRLGEGLFTKRKSNTENIRYFDHNRNFERFFTQQMFNQKISDVFEEKEANHDNEIQNEGFENGGGLENFGNEELGDQNFGLRESFGGNNEEEEIGDEVLKTVNINELKDDMIKILDLDCGDKENLRGVESGKKSTKASDGKMFSEFYVRIMKEYLGKKVEMNLETCFLTMLHIANEKGLVLEQSGNDFVITG